MSTQLLRIQLHTLDGCDMFTSSAQFRGLSLISAVVLIWVLASFLVQNIEQSGGVRPVVLTYVANSLFVVYFPIRQLVLSFQKWRRTGRRPSAPSTPDAGGQEAQTDGTDEEATLVQTADEPTPAELQADTVLSWRHCCHAASIVAPLWFSAQWSFNASLSMTSVTSNTILASLASLFAFLGSVVCLGEQFTALKLVFIACAVAGSGLVAAADGQHSSRDSVLGDGLCLVSGLCYAAYTICIQLYMHSATQVDMMLFFAMLGVWNIVLFAPLVCVLAWDSLRQLHGRVLLILVTKGLFDNVLSDYLWAMSILLLGPTIATLGLSLQVPLAVALDVLFGHPSYLESVLPAALTAGGAVLVLVGFCGITLQGSATAAH